MATTMYFLLVLALIAAVWLILRFQVAAREYWKLSGKMLVTCPENRHTEAVEIASGRAAAEALLGREHLELKTCSRWPERKDCGQDCLSQLEKDPASHWIWNIATSWYAGKSCIYCKKPIVDLNHFDHRPALLSLEGKTVEWDEIRAQDLPEMLASSLPVCWNCHIAETFRHEHPELVVQRPGRG